MASQKRPVAMITGGTRGIGSGIYIWYISILISNDKTYQINTSKFIGLSKDSCLMHMHRILIAKS